MRSTPDPRFWGIIGVVLATRPTQGQNSGASDRGVNRFCNVLLIGKGSGVFRNLTRFWRKNRVAKRAHPC